MAPKPTLGRARRGRGRLTTKITGRGGGLGTGYKARGKRTGGALGPAAPRAGRPGFRAGQAKPGLGAPGATPTPSPAAPAAPQGQRFVPDSIYENRVNTLDTRQDQLLNELEGQETQVKHEFGIEDPTNPFSRAEGLKKAFLARQKAASASLASQGQLYSGAHERALSRTRRDEEQARAELRKAYEGAIGQIGAEKAGVKFSTEEEKNQAFEEWLARQEDADVPITGETAAPAPEEAPPAPSTPPRISPEVPVAISNSRQETTTRPPKAGLPLAPPPPSKGRGKGKLRTKITGGGAGLGYKPRAKQGKGKAKPRKSQMQPTTVVKAKPRAKVRKKGRR